MSSTPNSPKLPFNERRSKVIGLGLAVIITFGAIVIYLSFQSDRKEEQISQGLDLLYQGCHSRSSEQLQQAKEHFIEAARLEFLDPYPKFLAQATDEIENAIRGRLLNTDPFSKAIQSIASGQYPLARQYLLELSKKEEQKARADYYLRLITELERRNRDSRAVKH